MLSVLTMPVLFVLSLLFVIGSIIGAIEEGFTDTAKACIVIGLITSAWLAIIMLVIL